MDEKRHRENLARVEATLIRTGKTIERSRLTLSQAEEAGRTTKALIAEQSVWDLAVRLNVFSQTKKGPPEATH
jgi:hypothetical protein